VELERRAFMGPAIVGGAIGGVLGTVAGTAAGVAEIHKHHVYNHRRAGTDFVDEHNQQIEEEFGQHFDTGVGIPQPAIEPVEGSVAVKSSAERKREANWGKWERKEARKEARKSRRAARREARRQKKQAKKQAKKQTKSTKKSAKKQANDSEESKDE